MYAILGRWYELPVPGRQRVWIFKFKAWIDIDKVFSDFMLSDGNIRYFEYVQDKFEYLSEHKSADPQRGVAFLPKRGVNVGEPLIAMAYVLVNLTTHMLMKGNRSMRMRLCALTGQ